MKIYFFVIYHGNFLIHEGYIMLFLMHSILDSHRVVLDNVEEV